MTGGGLTWVQLFSLPFPPLDSVVKHHICLEVEGRESFLPPAPIGLICCGITPFFNCWPELTFWSPQP